MKRDDGRRAARPTLRRSAAATIVLIVVAAHAVSVDAWMRRNGFYARPCFGDAAAYRVQALTLRRALVESPAAFLKTALELRAAHAPGVAAAAAIVGFDDDVTPRDAVVVQGFVALLFAAGTYRLARRWSNRGGAVLAVVFALGAPVVALSGRPLYPQFPMAACLVWATWVLTRSRGLSRLRSAAAYGAWVGLALLFKAIAPVYVIGGAATAAAIGLRRKETRARTLAGIAISAIVAAALAGPFYARNLDLTFGRVSEVSGEAGQAAWSQGVSYASIERWAYYPREFATRGLGYGLAAAVVVAGATLIATRRRRESAVDATGPRDDAAAILVGETLATYVLLSIGQIAGGAFYVTGWCATAGVVVAAAYGRASSRRARAALVVFTIFGAGFGRCLVERPIGEDRATKWVGGVALDPPVDVMFGALLRPYELEPRPIAEPWPGAEIVAYATPAVRSAPSRIALPPFPPIGPNPLCCHVTLEYEALRMRRPISLEWAAAAAAEADGKHAWRNAALEASFLFFEERWLSVEAAAAFAAPFGLRIEPVFRRSANAFDRFALAVARPSWAPPRRAEAADLEAARFTKMSVAFENGPTLTGFRVAIVDGVPSLALAFERGPGSDGERTEVDARREGSKAPPVFDLVDFAPIDGVAETTYRTAFLRDRSRRPLRASDSESAYLVRLRTPDGRPLRPIVPAASARKDDALRLSGPFDPR